MSGPADLGSELFCATGSVSTSVAEHAEFLLQQHEAGALRLYDRGALDPADPAAPLRHRMTWQRDGDPVSAVLVLLARDEQVRLWFAARCPAGWGHGVPSPLIRAGLARFPLADPRSGLAVTGSTLRDDPEDVAGLLAATRDRRGETAVLVRHVDREPGSPLVVPRRSAEFRKATMGCASMVFIGDAVARRLAAELPERLRIPWRGGRLFLPSAWSAERDDPRMSEVDAEGAGAWPEAVDLALRVSRRRETGTADAELWSMLFTTAWHDERVADTPAGPGERWFAVAGGADKSDLRQRIQGAGARQAESKEAAARRADAVSGLNAEIDQATARLAGLERSRRRLASAALRLRAERDVARERLAGTSLGVARGRQDAAVRSARAAARRLADREQELERLRGAEDRSHTALGRAAVPEPIRPVEPAGVRFGPGVGAEIERLDDARARRCRQVLDLLAAHAAAPGPSLAERLRAEGIAPGVPSPVEHAAVTFRVPSEVDPSGWAPFPEFARLDHAGDPRCVLHYLDDTAGPTGVVHVGHVGPELAAGAP
ncbi:hypothetical protein GCM10027271_07730 [Saccharopolyspora gloriosae]|uniref:Uncharacterized protein n=1 Tax=Saccharopolyspora gloriosae TaxID=455344 RepID=A0A840NMK1_9PSEU|nr:hypothetical protein [Saccharopolyspora gloriosae]MBB5072321.1 hypothetical protein [Saccharopolyspora gloriosae]